jgi:hypothetical protein
LIVTRDQIDEIVHILDHSLTAVATDLLAVQS